MDIFSQKIYKILQGYENEFSVLNASYEAEEVELLIGIFWKASTICSSVTLPPDMLSFAGKNKISITINTYATSDDEYIEWRRQPACLV